MDFDDQHICFLSIAAKKREFIMDNYGSLNEELYKRPLVMKIEAYVLRQASPDASNVSLEDPAEISPLDIPTSQCCELRCELRRANDDDPMWRTNRVLETSEDHDIARPDSSLEDFYNRLEK